MILANPDYLMWWREERLLPEGSGFYSGWLKSSDCLGASAFTMVDEFPDDADATYLLTDTATGTTCAAGTGPQKQSFAMQNPAAIAGADTILRVTAHAKARKDGAPTDTFRVGIREASTDVFASTQTLGASYVDYTHAAATKPSGGAWTLATVNGAEAIIESVAIGAGSTEEICTQVHLIAEYIVMPTLPAALLAGHKNRRLQNRLVYMPPEFFVAKRPKSLPQAAAPPAPYFSDRSKKRRSQPVFPEITAGFQFGRARAKVLPFGLPPPPSTAVFTQPQRIRLNRRGPSITVRGRG